MRKKSFKSGDIGFSEETKNFSTKNRQTTGNTKSSNLLKEKGKFMFSNKINRPYKGSFCHIQKGAAKDINHEPNIYGKDYKTPLKTSKISVNLSKPNRVSVKEPFTTTITLDSRTDDKEAPRVEKPEFFHNRQLLSGKMFNQTLSMVKSNPFQPGNIGSKEKVKTSLEIYSKTLRHTKGTRFIIIFS